MGGFGAVKLAFKYPQMFSSVVSYGGAIYDVQTFKTRREVLYDAIFSSDRSAFQAQSPYALLERNSVQIRENLKISLYVGEWDVTYGLNAMFREALKAHNMTHSYKVVKRVSHNLGRYLRRVGCEGFSFSLDHF
jgi:S-formylglutathione hydrolase FrmB